MTPTGRPATILKPALRCRKFAIIVKQSGDGQWYFVVEAANGEPMATSETYTRKTDALRAADTFKERVSAANIVVID